MATSALTGFSYHQQSPQKLTYTQFQYQEGSQLNQDMKSKADLKPELFIFGQITGGKDFPVDNNQGLFCELNVEFDNDWELLSMAKLGQSQTAYQCGTNLWVWNHPFELFWEPKNKIYWPRFSFRVWKLNEMNSNHIMAFGSLKLPKTSGYHRLEIQTWTLGGEIQKNDDEPLNLNHKIYEFYLQNQPYYVKKEFTTTDQLSQGICSGKIIVEVEIVMKNFELLDITGQQE